MQQRPIQLAPYSPYPPYEGVTLSGRACYMSVSLARLPVPALPFLKFESEKNGVDPLSARRMIVILAATDFGEAEVFI